jgi:hypothetical protein
MCLEYRPRFVFEIEDELRFGDLEECPHRAGKGRFKRSRDIPPIHTPPLLRDRPLDRTNHVTTSWIIRTFGEAWVKALVFRIVTSSDPFEGSAPVNALKPRRSVKHHHQK